MRDPVRITMILAALEREWRKNPDVRLGQLLINTLRVNANVAHEQEGRVLFDTEDGELLRWLGPVNEAERSYIREEPQKAREGWRQWQRCSRDSDAYRE